MLIFTILVFWELPKSKSTEQLRSYTEDIETYEMDLPNVNLFLLSLPSTQTKLSIFSLPFYTKRICVTVPFSYPFVWIKKRKKWV